MKIKVASAITRAMATWTFIVIFLTCCGAEIWFNQSPLVPQNWKFDVTMLVLNTLLSLMAAIQGSIIMIDARQADEKRDAILQRLLFLEEQIAEKEGISSATVQSK